MTVGWENSSRTEQGQDETALTRSLRDLGVGPEVGVGIFLPLLPETVMTVLALGKLKAIYIPIFSGYAPPAVRERLEDEGLAAAPDQEVGAETERGRRFRRRAGRTAHLSDGHATPSP